MLLFLEKQYRQENRIFNMLAEKIKKSKKIVRTAEGIHRTREEYTLDNIKIYFDIPSCTLRVEENVSNPSHRYYLACQYQSGDTVQDKLQRARNEMFIGLLNIARQTYEKKLEQGKKFENAIKLLRRKIAPTYNEKHYRCALDVDNWEKNALAEGWIKSL